MGGGDGAAGGELKAVGGAEWGGGAGRDEVGLGGDAVTSLGLGVGTGLGGVDLILRRTAAHDEEGEGKARGKLGWRELQTLRTRHPFKVRVIVGAAVGWNTGRASRSSEENATQCG